MSRDPYRIFSIVVVVVGLAAMFGTLILFIDCFILGIG